MLGVMFISHLLIRLQSNTSKLGGKPQVLAAAQKG
jgi:hypothetical protein